MNRATMMKTCTNCGECLPSSEFYKAATPANPDRLHTWCKTCSKEKVRLWKLANRQRSPKKHYPSRAPGTNGKYDYGSEYYREATRRYRERNPGKVALWGRLSRAARRNRTPCWANEKKIDQVYRLAKWASRFTSEPLEVDHIIPLRGSTVSGLHVESNLQILTSLANKAKGNNVVEETHDRNNTNHTGGRRGQRFVWFPGA